MSKKSYSDLLRHPLWQKKRLEIMRRDKWKCKKCGDDETTLNVHHKLYINGNDPWEYENEDLITLCEDCHNQIERFKKESPEIDLETIKIYKSEHWSSDKRIMFASYPGLLSMEIYDEKDKFIVGFNFTGEIERREIIKALKYSLR